jgi:hypothetical protein
VKTLTLYAILLDEDGCTTDYRTAHWLNRNSLRSVRFESKEAAIRYAKHAIRAALDSEIADQRMLFSEGVEREYNHEAGEWTVLDYPDSIVAYNVPYRERRAEIDWSDQTVQVTEWAETHYPEFRQVTIETVHLLVIGVNEVLEA